MKFKKIYLFSFLSLLLLSSCSDKDLNLSTLTIIPPTNGSVILKNNIPLEYIPLNTLLEFDVYPDDGYKLDSMVINDSIDISSSYLFKVDIKDDYILKTTFIAENSEDINKNSVEIECSEGGKVVANKLNGNVGEVITLNVFPDEGYKLSTIKVNEVTLPKNDQNFYEFILNKGINKVYAKFVDINIDEGWDYSYLYDAKIIKPSRGNLGDIDSYYEPCRGLKGKELKDALHDIIDDHVEFGYSSSTNKAMKYYDADPFNSNNIIFAYEDSLKNSLSFNKEHTWAKSHGGFDTSRPAGSDYHNLRACHSSLNSTRSNDDFGVVESHNMSNSMEGRDWYRDTMKGNYRGVGKNINKKVFEPRDSTKGDTARIIFYMATRYSGDGEPFLEVDGTIPSNFYDFSTLSGVTGTHGNFIDLYNWLELDPVDDFEVNRNNIIDQKYQHNRNPFVDHPEFVRMIYDKTYDGLGALEE